MKKNNIIYLIISFLIVFSFSINLSIINSNISGIFSLFYILSFFGIYKFLINREKKKRNVFYLIMSIIISIVTVLITCIDNYSILSFNLYLVIKLLFMIIGYIFIFYYLIDYLFIGLNKITYKKTKNKIIEFIFDKHPFISSFIIILICYIPVLLIFYPGILMNDGADVIREYYCLRTFSTNYINLIDPNVCINTHHSAFYAYILGSLFSMKNTVLSVFMFALIQIIIQALVLADSIRLLKKMNINYVVRVIILLLYCFLPFYNINSIGIYKDILISNLCLLFICLIIEFTILKENNNWKLFFILLFSLLIALLSSKGFFIVTLSLLLLVCVSFKSMRWKSLLFILPIIIFELYSGILLPKLHVTNGSIREALVIPIQQVSNYVVNNYDKVTDEEKKTIGNILEYDKIKDKYNTTSADSVKCNIFNKDYTDEELSAFMKLWIKLFFKDPTSYIKAHAQVSRAYLSLNTINYDYKNKVNIVYWGPSVKNYGDDNLKEELVLIHPELIHEVRTIYTVITRIPIINILFVFGFYTWLLLLLLFKLIIDKKIRLIVPFIPSLVVLLFCFVSPVNGLWRYIYPIIYSTPVLICYYVFINKKEKI